VTDPLPSWRDGAARQSIEAFVTAAATEGGPGFIAPAERIAVFDNDGTLWSEQPLYFQFLFALDRVHALAPTQPDWTTRDPFKSLLAEGPAAVAKLGMEDLLAVMNATHSGMSTDAFGDIVRAWLSSARHPHTGKRFDTMIFAPMVELIRYLEGHGFRVFIVSGGGQEFLRAWVERTYGIPPERVIGSYAGLEYGAQDGQPVVMKTAQVGLVDDHAGKPVGIQRFIGRRPAFAFGNSDGDFEMLEWTTSAPGPRFAGLLHHTDGAREFAYDRNASIGKLDRALDAAPARGWTVVDMARDWRVVYAPD